MSQNRPPQQPQVNQEAMESALQASPLIVCDTCGNATFEEVIMFKSLSALVSPNGKAGLAPFNVFSCNACGHVNNQFLPSFMKTVKEASTSDIKQSSLKLEK
jgi:uncharacterized Zn finger protein